LPCCNPRPTPFSRNIPQGKKVFYPQEFSSKFENSRKKKKEKGLKKQRKKKEREKIFGLIAFELR